MAWDLLLRRETDSDFSIDLPGSTKTAALDLTFSPSEIKSLKLLEPSTRVHVVEVVGWARNKGIPAKLSTNVIYTPADSARHYAEGRSGIAPGRLDWHQVGRAYHLVIIDPATRQLDKAAYARVGAYVRSRGGEWLGDKTIITPKGPIQDTAHFEYHPDWNIATYRKMPLAQLEYQKAQSRAARFG
jgi:hypothetical protein